MDKFVYENQGANTYLIYELGENEMIDSLSLGMITNNHINGIIPIIYTQMDQKRYFKYNVTSKVSVKQFFEGTVNKKRFLSVISSISSTILLAEEYMIETSSFLYDLEYIFADVTNCDTTLVCIPTVHEIQMIDLKNFFKNIVFSTQFDQSENCDYVARIIGLLNNSATFSLRDFKDAVDLMMNQNASISSGKIYTAQKPMMQPNNMQSVSSNPNHLQHNIEPPVINKQNNTYQEAAIAREVNLLPQEKKAKKDKSGTFSSLLSGKNKKTSRSSSMPVEIPQAPGSPVQMQPILNYQTVNKKGKTKGKSKDKKVLESQPILPLKESGKQNSNYILNNSQVPLNQRAVNIQQPVNSPNRPIPTSYAMTNPYQSPSNNQLNFGETTVLNSAPIGETTVLGVGIEQKSSPFLIRKKNNEKIYLNKPVFRLGKEKGYVDYFIGDNSAISRSHANIVSKEGKCFLIDTNSTNHTFLNGQIINSNVEAELNHGMRIRLANEEFEFNLY